MLRRLWHYLNPMAHVGERRYPLNFPFFTTIIVYILIEFFGYVILKRPNDIGNIIIFTNFALILYFSFRSALKGGMIVLGLSILYYIYFISSRHVPFGEKEMSSIIVGLLSLTNLLIVLLLGWLRMSLDDLLDREIQAKLAAEHEQKRWQTVMEQLPVGVMIAEAPTGEIIIRNDKAYEILGTIKGEFAKSIQEYRTYNATFNGEKLKSQEWPLARALLEGKTIPGEEIILNRKGKSLTLFVNAAPIFDGKGKIIAAVTTFYDITQQKELERQKDDFIGMVSHELRTPLTSAKIYAQAAIKTTSGNPKAKNMILEVDDQLEKLSQLVSTMLATTRLEQGKLRLKEEPFILRDTALKTLSALQDTTEHKITVDWQTDEYLYGNKEQVSQVLTNLITNAIKYSPKKSEIIVKSQTKDGFVTISVQDFGVGLSKEDQEHVFDRFYQSKDHKTYPGLGLGLYISSEIIKQYGGKIWVESEKGKGSTFSFSLPIYKK